MTEEQQTQSQQTTHTEVKPVKEDKPLSAGLLAKLKWLGMPIKRHQKLEHGKLEDALPWLRVAKKNKER